ncbi:MAG: thioredoxin domain-containing protein [Ramlibacter sp.]|nr:thioredoxin domain-containing protein [Cryobacterium sp.]
MGASPLRDPVEGGFFRYAVNRDWSDPHYERMLYDNAQLLDLYTRAWQLTGERWARSVAEGVGRFLITVLRLPGGGFASAQDSESTVAGRRVEGGYYALDEDARQQETPPALDEKVLTGWNGLGIAALARAGFAFDNPAFTTVAARTGDYLLEHHLRRDGSLVRASIAGRTSTAQPTLEDFGMLASGLLELALATGEVRYATAGRRLIDATLSTATATATAPATGSAGVPFRAPDGPDPVLAGQGLSLDVDPSEGAYPSGITATAEAAHLLFLLTGDERYRTAAGAAMALLADRAQERPLAFGAALRLMAELTGPAEQLVVVRQEEGGPTGPLLDAVRRRAAGLVASVTQSQAGAFTAAGFELFRDRTVRDDRPTAYLCRDFVCRLPVIDPGDLPGRAD